MAKSRLAAGAFPFLLAAAPAQGQAPIALSPADSAAVDRAMTKKPGSDPACIGAANVIVVCGHRIGGGGQRMEFEREPGEIVRHINEPGGAVGAMSDGGCFHSCYQPVKIDVLGAARAAPKIIRHILGHDD